MIELRNDRLVFTFPEIHKKAKLTVTFQRTLRIPDDGSAYHLPPGLGRFSMRHVDDYADDVPSSWVQRGGVMLPMYQSEAMWLNFDSGFVEDHDVEYPFAVQIGTGMINAANGKKFGKKLIKKNQNYLVVPEQPWLDGYCVGEGLIRQFVAMPLGGGYTAEEQVTGKAEYGGLQIIAFPMKREIFEQHFPKRTRYHADHLDDEHACYSSCAPMEMGLAPGGLMKQEIYRDPYKKSDWNQSVFSRCYVHLANSMVWRDVTGQEPPTVPFTAREYTSAGLPWFDYYDDQAAALKGSKVLKKLKSVKNLGDQKGEKPLPENNSVTAGNIVKLRKGNKKFQVREWNLEPF